MDNPTPQQYLPHVSSGNRSRASSAASRYTPEGYPVQTPPVQPNTEGYYPVAPTSQPSYPSGNLMVPPTSAPFAPSTPPTSSHPPFSGTAPNPPYPTDIGDPLMRPASHSRHASHSSQHSHRSHHSRHSGDERRDREDGDRPHHAHHHSHRSDHHRRNSDRDDYYSSERERHGHPLRQAERASSEASSERPLKRTSTNRPTLGDTVVAMWDGLKTALGPRDR